MCFTGGLTLDRQQLQHGGFGSLTDTIFSFASSLKIMEVDDLEYAALSAVCLVSNGKLSIVQKPHQWCNGWLARLECSRP